MSTGGQKYQKSLFVVLLCYQQSLSLIHSNINMLKTSDSDWIRHATKTQTTLCHPVIQVKAVDAGAAYPPENTSSPRVFGLVCVALLFYYFLVQCFKDFCSSLFFQPCFLLYSPLVSQCSNSRSVIFNINGCQKLIHIIYIVFFFLVYFSALSIPVW